MSTERDKARCGMTKTQVGRRDQTNSGKTWVSQSPKQKKRKRL